MRAWLLALGAAALLHLWLLAPSPRPPLALAGLPAMQTRQLNVEAKRPEPDAQTATAPLPISRAPLIPKSTPAATPPPAAASAAPPPELLNAPPLLASAVQSLPEGSLDYTLEQAGQLGTARLSWQISEGRYQLRLERELPGRRLPDWRSEGLVRAEGLLPERFAMQRQGQDRQAINFRRDEGLISYSGHRALHPLPEGVQDRLSWWLQLPAMVAAAPERLQPGQQLVLNVAALRGPPLLWLFRFEGSQADGLWHFSREAMGPFDARLDVWLDPARHFLPTRVRQSVGDEERWELQLQTPAP
ncbi:hypothetical protein RQP53_12615 [Paucibacter sp. APW11]|uniref:DUF3108 domain-containing protein n=1 Tax=Roseateles aquae TaxID=3077235 RepID=A0ABU3PC18_9BURK|nr:hypothetical protein [Paucibacter sp. APW11]MDT9000111.1 hypothetical protein [Paucibacter sp. APW11]